MHKDVIAKGANSRGCAKFTSKHFRALQKNQDALPVPKLEINFASQRPSSRRFFERTATRSSRIKSEPYYQAFAK